MGGVVEVLLVLALVVFAIPVALLVVVFASISGLKQRVWELERQLAELKAGKPVQPASPETDPELEAEPQAEDMPQTEVQPMRPWAWLDEPESVGKVVVVEPETEDTALAFEMEQAPVAKAAPPPVPEVSPQAAEPTPVPTPSPALELVPLEAAPSPEPTPEPTPAPTPSPTMPPAAHTPDLADRIVGGIKRWFTSGNLPVKVGMLVLLAGVVALLRYAGQQGWIQLPIELRLLGVAAVATAGVVLGWRQRTRRPQFALALQGGAIGALLLTIFAASKMYAVLPLGMAFVLSVLLIAAAGVMAVLQDSRTLAILATLAGFCAPLWLSDGSGNHVGLFSYYAVLNLAIFAVVWHKPWRVLMMLGFVFTWGIGVFWGVLAYRPEFYDSAQAFLALFFVLYLLMPLLHARKQEPGRGELINGGLLFATPLIAFSLQAGLMSGNRIQLAFVAVGVAAIYALLGAWLRGRERYRVLFDAYVLMAAGFATLAIPLAFSAKVTGALFAVEGALLVWFGLRHQRALPLWSGIGLQLAAGMAHFVARVDYAAAKGFAEASGTKLAALAPVLNGFVIGGLLLALMGFASAWMLWRDRQKGLSTALYVWGLLCWGLLWLGEIMHFAPTQQWLEWSLILAAVTGWLAAEVLRKTRAEMEVLALTSMLAMAAGLLAALLHFQSDGWMNLLALFAWVIYAGLGWRSLICLRSHAGGSVLWTQGIWWLVWPLTLMMLLDTLYEYSSLGSSWLVALRCLPWAAALLVVLHRPKLIMAPLGERFAPALPRLARLYWLPLGVLVVVSLFFAGNAAPLPWLPIVNPLELMQLLTLGLLLHWLRGRMQEGYRWGLLTAVMLGWVTLVTLRALHHLGDVAWSVSMWSSSLVQTSLTLLWSVLGMLAWVVGSRRGYRGLWLLGALLMGLVLVKLLLIDRQHLGNLLGIGSFIAYGLLCTVVGYLAPAPPRTQQESAT